MTAQKKHHSNHNAGSAHAFELKCTEPNCEFVTKKSVFAKQELGRHLKFIHGIAGRSSSAGTMQERKAQSVVQTLASISTTNESNQNGTEIMIPQQKRQYKKRDPLSLTSGAYTNGEAIALITVGRIQAYCEAEAKKFGISEESFTTRCAQLFFATQIRK